MLWSCLLARWMFLSWMVEGGETSQVYKRYNWCHWQPFSLTPKDDRHTAIARRIPFSSTSASRRVGMLRYPSSRTIAGRPGSPWCQRCGNNLVLASNPICMFCDSSCHWWPGVPEPHPHFPYRPALLPTSPSPAFHRGHGPSGGLAIFDPMSNIYYPLPALPPYGASSLPLTDIRSPSPEPEFWPPLPEEFDEEVESGSVYSTPSGTLFESTISSSATGDTVGSGRRSLTIRPDAEDEFPIERGPSSVSPRPSWLRLVWRKFWMLFAIVVGTVRSHWRSGTMAINLAATFLRILCQARTLDAMYLLLLILYHRRAPRAMRCGA